ncbi:hypothetical protein CP977_17035 [Streptomyces cinereoruber]|uniref:Uncharacterized protein n=1 Tax=Streptomyces cinereoruber TaxID=67260 RepID=A0ABX6BHR8_9ACTN|nr:hypothetical protein CP977_17035 [Streptomyces cinereoruber]
MAKNAFLESGAVSGIPPSASTTPCRPSATSRSRTLRSLSTSRSSMSTPCIRTTVSRSAVILVAIPSAGHAVFTIPVE